MNFQPIDRQITKEDLIQIIEEQQKTIAKMNLRIEQIESRIPNPERNKDLYSKIVSKETNYKPAPKVDSEGEDFEDTSEEIDQNKWTPFDFAPVKNIMKAFKNLDLNSLKVQSEQVDKDLRKHKDDNSNNPMNTKPKPQTRMNNDKRN